MSTISTTFTRFLELPGELRNQIYKEAAAAMTKIKISADGTISKPPLAFVSTQIHDEFPWNPDKNDFTTTYLIKAEVEDCNFDPLIQVLEARKKTIIATVHIQLKLSATGSECLHALRLWLSYCRLSCIHGLSITNTVEVDRESWKRDDADAFKIASLQYCVLGGHTMEAQVVSWIAGQVMEQLQADSPGR